MILKKTLIVLFILTVFTTLILFYACEEPAPSQEAGKISVTLTDANDADGQKLYAYLFGPGETDLNNPDALIATNNAVISGGAVSFTLENDDGGWMPDGTEWTGEGDSGGDIYIYTDADTDGDSDPATSSGIPCPKKAAPFPMAVSIDGDQSISLTYLDMTDYNGGPHQGRVTVQLTGASDADGQYLYAYLYAAGEIDINNPDTVLAVNSVLIAGSSASCILEEDDGSWIPNGTVWLGDGGAEYDVYIYTDANIDDDNDPTTSSGDPGPKASLSFPTLIQIDKDYTVSNEYSSMQDYPVP